MSQNCITVHLWRYTGGYTSLNEAKRIYRTDEVKFKFNWQSTGRLAKYVIEPDLKVSENWGMFVWLQEFLHFRLIRNKMLRYRTNQILMPFSFWNDIKPREGKWIYEMRRYTLKVSEYAKWNASLSSTSFALCLQLNYCRNSLKWNWNSTCVFVFSQEQWLNGEIIGT